MEERRAIGMATVADYAELLRLSDTDGDGVFETRATIAPLPTADRDRPSRSWR